MCFFAAVELVGGRQAPPGSVCLANRLRCGVLEASVCRRATAHLEKGRTFHKSSSGKRLDTQPVASNAHAVCPERRDIYVNRDGKDVKIGSAEANAPSARPAFSGGSGSFRVDCTTTDVRQHFTKGAADGSTVRRNEMTNLRLMCLDGGCEPTMTAEGLRTLETSWRQGNTHTHTKGSR